MSGQFRLLSCASLLLITSLACTFTQRFIYNTAGPQAGADIVASLAAPATSAPGAGTLAPIEGQTDASSCDATSFVSVRVGERFIPNDSANCYQVVVLTNVHPSLPVIVMGHHVGTQGASGSGKLVQPQSESTDQWSVVYDYGDPFTVDWYTAILATPQCMWLDDLREGGIEQLPPLGLRVVPFTVPSCSAR